MGIASGHVVYGNAMAVGVCVRGAVELFKAQLDYLARSPKYAMAQHLTQLQDSAKAAGITGWKSTLRSSEEQAELENQFVEVKIGEAMTVRGDLRSAVLACCPPVTTHAY